MDMMARGMASQPYDAWQTWTPTITWAGATPTGVTAIARYKKIGKTVFYAIKINATDGNGASGWHQITLPITPKQNDVMPACTVLQSVGATYTARYGYTKDDVTEGYARISTGTLTAASAAILWIRGEYETEA